MKFVIEHRLSQDQQLGDILLKEYELTQAAYYEIEKNVWTSASIFVVTSLGGISILATVREHNWASFAMVGGVALASILVLWTWLNITRRWWDIQNVHLYRMYEIETELGMWKSRYVDYLDKSRIFGRRLPADPTNDPRLYALDQAIPRYSQARVHRRMRLLLLILMTGWLALIVRELLLTVPLSIWRSVLSLLGI